ncbi:deoxyribonuclease-2-alpha [Periophthalmus magnuspinnatus]|uniref:deoxyribonuclease-2-alpha n=1 Tax=Periophthalmus magnuspinnatus TaxID=409849 RepID=UPI00145BF280|nr:deoxyribonuclease-2-alpha [Periophthalmus magnuspinnatus]
MSLLVLLLPVLLLPPGGSTSPISCYNDLGAPVDWFYVYKLPRAVGGRSEEEGLEYLLLEKGSEAWAKGSVNINHTNGAVGRTVGQLYTQTKGSETAYVLYNDQSPVVGSVGLGRSSGHTKGVVVLDKEQGFWLVHSTPHFPPPQQAGNYSYPDTGLTNGQSFLCVTYPLERFHTIGEQLHINQPHVYDCHVPEALASLVPSLSTLCRKSRPSRRAPPLYDKPWLSPFQAPPPLTPVSNRSVVLNSSEGTAFISFAKGAAFNNDLYHSWVARELHCPLLVQFWVRSTGVLPSDCSEGVTVLNIQLLSPGPSPSFNNTVDHSKWAVSPEGAQAGGGWVCVGDINRNHAEERRGGGTVCLQDPLVWKAYRSAALQCQDCEGRTTTC